MCVFSSHVEHESQEEESKDGRCGHELYSPGGVPVAAAVAAEVLVVSCQELLLRLPHGTEREGREGEKAGTHPIEGTREPYVHGEVIHTYVYPCRKNVHN